MITTKKCCWILMLLAACPCGAADAEIDRRFPVRGLCIAAPSASQVERFADFIEQALAPRAVNTLILRVDYNFQFTRHPELSEPNALTRAHVGRIVEASRKHGIRVIPQINLLGHQSWHTRTGNLLKVYPEFDETPWVKMPERYVWPNPDRLYCKSYCPLHPKVHEVVFALVDEICEAFEAKAFHAGLDEVFYIGEDRCPRCAGRDKAELFAGEVRRIRDHLAQKGRTLWMWGDRLLDGSMTGLGEWEASISGTHRAIDLVPKDVVICDWHYERADPTAAMFALKGFQVVSCPWKNPAAAFQQVHDVVRLREHSTAVVRDRVLGVVQTVWSGAQSFLDELSKFEESGARPADQKSESACFLKVAEAWGMAAPSSGRPPAAPKER